MESLNSQGPGYFLRLPSDKPAAEKLEAMLEEEAVEEVPEEAILCAQCCQVITSAAERIAVQGSHQHTFTNPHGIIFQIGCYRSAKRCRYAGPVTEEWSWFKGFRWRIAVCSSCLTHLGWLFACAGKESFHGLILNRLIQPD